MNPSSRTKIPSVVEVNTLAPLLWINTLTTLLIWILKFHTSYVFIYHSNTQISLH